MNNQRRYFYKEYFNLGIVLHGEANDLEEIKNYIIVTFVYNRLVRLLKPTYKEGKLCILNESEYREYKKVNEKKERKIIDESERFHFAFILRGEVKHLEEIKEYINQYKSVELITATYEIDRLYIVEES